jgi:hypothetical protein
MILLLQDHISLVTLKYSWYGARFPTATYTRGCHCSWVATFLPVRTVNCVQTLKEWCDPAYVGIESIDDRKTGGQNNEGCFELQGGWKPVWQPLLMFHNQYDKLQNWCRKFHVIDRDLGTVRVFQQQFSLQDAIGSHACSLQASRHVV